MPDAHSAFGVVSSLVRRKPWDLIATTQDWHPRDHVSFAATHRAAVFSTRDVPLPGSAHPVAQVMWPTHCVQHTRGADIHPTVGDALAHARAHGVPIHHVYKGCDARVDSYSGFADNTCVQSTDLERALRAARISSVVICGLATDYCVRATALDAAKRGFDTAVCTDAARGVDAQSAAHALDAMRAAGCRMLTSVDV